MWPFNKKKKEDDEDKTMELRQPDKKKKMSLRDENVKNIIRKQKKGRKEIMSDLFKD